MNRLSRIVFIFFLVMLGHSQTSFAAYFFFLKNNGQQVGQGINLSGTLTVPENALGTHPALTFAIPDTLQTSRVFLEKSGECLDQGVNHVGLNQTITADAPNADYTLTLSVDASATSAGCATGNPAPVRTAAISGPGINNWTGSYHLYNTASIPEPGSLALLGLGLSALVFVKRRRAGQR